MTPVPKLVSQQKFKKFKKVDDARPPLRVKVPCVVRNGKAFPSGMPELCTRKMGDGEAGSITIIPFRVPFFTLPYNPLNTHDKQATHKGASESKCAQRPQPKSLSAH